MAKAKQAGAKPPPRHRCMVEGCAMYGIWQEVVEGEEFMMDTEDPRSHYFREHYVASEAAYHQKLADQRAERIAHYRLTGEFLPPTL